jgi:transposase
MMGTTLDTEIKPGNRKGRPNYPVEFKRRLAAAACEAGVSVSKLAMANEVNANMVFKWRREYRAGLFEDLTESGTALLPVVLAESSLMAVQGLVPVAEMPLVRPGPTATSSAIEVIFADAVIRVHKGVDEALLRTIFQSLRP